MNENLENVQFLTPADELALVKLYLNKIPQLCGHFRRVPALMDYLTALACYSSPSLRFSRLPDEVEDTAMTYLKRFYLKNTVMDWHPKNVMYERSYG